MRPASEIPFLSPQMEIVAKDEPAEAPAGGTAPVESVEVPPEEPIEQNEEPAETEFEEEE